MSRLTWVPDQELRFDFGYGTVTLFGPTFQTARLSKLHSRVIPTGPRNPRSTRVDPVWAIPLSLATTNGITACFLFLRVLRCFTSPGLPRTAMDSPYVTAVLPAVGFPIRTSTDQSLVGGSPWLFAATHVLHRLSEPRHPPHALSSLVTLNSGLPSRWLERRLFKVEIQILRRSGAREDLAVRCSSYPSYSVVRVLRRRRTSGPSRTRGPGRRWWS